MTPIHKCQIHCHTIDPMKLEELNIEDKGKWMPFMFKLNTVIACKLATDEDDLLAYGGTTVFTENGDTYIIDTPWEEFEKIFLEFNNVPDTDREPNL